MEIMIPTLIVVGLLLIIGIFLAYSHYNRTEKIKLVKGTSTDLNTGVTIQQMETLDWKTNVYQHNSDLIKTEFDTELGAYVPEYLMLEDIESTLKASGFKCDRSYTDQYDDVGQLWSGVFNKEHTVLRLSFQSISEDFVGWKPKEDKTFYLNQLQVVHSNPAEVANALMEKFANQYRKVVREKQTIDESTSVYEFTVSSFNGTYDLRRRNTQQLFQYGRVLSECPEMFKHIKWQFDGEKQEGFNGLAVAEMIEYCCVNSPRVNGGILFGKPGTGKTSFLNSLAFILGKNSDLQVILVSGPTMSDAAKMTALATKLAHEKDRDNNPVIIINEADSLLRLGSNGKKTPISEILMDLMDKYPCFLSCNCEKEEIHEAFYREGRGSFLFYVGNIMSDQLAPINTYVQKVAEEEESLMFIPKQFDSTPTLAQLFSQLKPAGWEEFKAKLKGNFSSVKAKETSVTVEAPSLAVSHQQHQTAKNNLQKFRSRNKR